MRFYKVDQRTPEWFEHRRGIPCTSGFKNIITPKGSATTGERRRKYIYRLAAERLLGYSMDDKFENYWTARGKELEPQAAEAFMAHMLGAKGRKRVILEDGGFITDDSGSIGCSPDRLVRYDTGERARECLEIKCPSPWEHLGYLLDGPSDDYWPQVQGQLLVGEFDVNHFWSFHPQMPPVHWPVLADARYQGLLSRALVDFCAELDAETDRARDLGTFTPGRSPPVDLPGIFPWMNEETRQ